MADNTSDRARLMTALEKHMPAWKADAAVGDLLHIVDEIRGEATAAIETLTAEVAAANEAKDRWRDQAHEYAKDSFRTVP